MPDTKLTTPVVLFFYHRPESTREVFAAIRKARPQRLFLVADGPKDAADAELCAAARAVVENIDWACEVQRNYAPANLGLRFRIPSGLDWVFDHVGETIILEDDCIPSQTFFGYCQELLDRFRDDERIMEISGSNYQLGRSRTQYSYYFSRYYGVWGWATWRRSWRHYDGGMSLWPSLRDAGFMEQILSDQIEREEWTRRFNAVYSGRFETWDWQWLFALWAQNGLSVVPHVNLVTNTGFGPGATTYTDHATPLAFLPRHEIGCLDHPPTVAMHLVADRFVFDHLEEGLRQRGVPGLIRRLYALLCRAGRHLLRRKSREISQRDNSS